MVDISSLHHVAACVADIPCVVRRDNVTPWKQVYITDPDGNVIELSAPR